MKLTPTMQSALDFAREHGDKLVRYPGGHWCEAMDSNPARPRRATQDFGTSTIEALVKREVCEYTQWVDGKHGRFPVEVTISEGFRQQVKE